MRTPSTSDAANSRRSRKSGQSSSSLSGDSRKILSAALDLLKSRDALSGELNNLGDQIAAAGQAALTATTKADQQSALIRMKTALSSLRKSIPHRSSKLFTRNKSHELAGSLYAAKVWANVISMHDAPQPEAETLSNLRDVLLWINEITKNVSLRTPPHLVEKGRSWGNLGLKLEEHILRSDFDEYWDGIKNIVKDHIINYDNIVLPIEQKEEGSLLVVPDKINALPEAPSKVWEPRPRGRPPKGIKYDDELISFIREVYGPYLKGKSLVERQQIRAYIFSKDDLLYRTIIDFERRKKLPRDIFMPSDQFVARKRIEKLLRVGLEGLTRRERRTVTDKARRRESQHGPKP